MKRPARYFLIMALLLLLGGCLGAPKGVSPITNFDAGRYMGDWFAVMRIENSFERGLSNVSATYSIRPDGYVGVLNRGFDRAKCRWRSIEGRASFQGAPNIASLSVSFFWPFAGGYHVIALDHEHYRWAMVAGPTRGYLWILAREARLDQVTIDTLMEKARELKFPIEELVSVDHSAIDCRAESSDGFPPRS
jgi:apolipoprotein D and lipocalin family protein